MQIQVTADELQELNDQVFALFQRYARSRRPDPPEGVPAGERDVPDLSPYLGQAL